MKLNKKFLVVMKVKNISKELTFFYLKLKLLLAKLKVNLTFTFVF